jgi:hypothetical protein
MMSFLTSMILTQASCLRLLVLTVTLFSTQVIADVYINKVIGAEEVESLASLMPKSLSPGGKRKVTINTSPMTITRSVTQSRREVNSALEGYLHKWSAEPEKFERDYSSLEYMADHTDQFTASQAVDHAMKLFGEDRARVIAELEQPVMSTAGPWTIVSHIPVAAIQPENKLADTDVTEGFIVFVDNTPQDNGYFGAWEIAFEEGFNLMHIIGQHNGDAPGHHPFGIKPLPGSRRTLTYEEQARGWDSATWTYETTGTIQSNLAFYVAEMEKLGFSQRGPTVMGDEQELIQMAKGNVSIVIHAWNTMTSSRPIQLTIQRLS